MYRQLLLIAAIALTPLAAFSQTIDDPTLTPAESQAKATLELLRETQSEVSGLRLPENRISFASELASLMWDQDEREARSTYAGVGDDFRQLIAQIDAQLNSTVKPTDDQSIYSMSIMTEPSDWQRSVRKATMAVSVRQSIVMNMADHDPEMALNFFYETQAVSNPDFKKLLAIGDSSLEQKLFDQLALADPAKAAQLAKRSLDKGFNAQQVDLLKKLYSKDPDKAADLAANYLAKIKSEASESLDLGAADSLLKYGAQLLDQSRTINGQRTVLSDSDLRDLADTLAQAVLARASTSNTPWATYARDVERFQPGRAVQIRARMQTRPDAVRTAPPNYRGPANSQSNVYTLRGNGNGSTNVAQIQAQLQRDANEKKMMDDIAKVGSNKINADQRAAIVAQARRTLMSTPGRDKKVVGLSALAAQVLKSGDKDLAGEIMRDASSFVNPQPKNYQDFLLSWMLASGYAAVEPDRAFPILDDTVGRTNEVLASAVRLAEFMDTGEEMVSDGEFQVGGFAGGPGGSIVRGLTSALTGFDGTLKLLATADFDRIRELTNRFDRPEARVLAKMMVLKALLGEKKPRSTTSSVPVK
jgi:hypothetical protein